MTKRDEQQACHGPRFVPVFRQLFVDDDAPAAAGQASDSGFSNPLLGLDYYHPSGTAWRFSAFLATTIPVGSGGGDDPDPGAAAAMTAATPRDRGWTTRSSP